MLIWGSVLPTALYLAHCEMLHASTGRGSLWNVLINLFKKAACHSITIPHSEQLQVLGVVPFCESFLPTLEVEIEISCLWGLCSLIIRHMASQLKFTMQYGAPSIRPTMLYTASSTSSWGIWGPDPRALVSGSYYVFFARGKKMLDLGKEEGKKEKEA